MPESACPNRLRLNSIAAPLSNMDVDLTELRDAVDVCEKEFSEVSNSISNIKEEDYKDIDEYISSFYENIHTFVDKTTELIATYQEYTMALENACSGQEE